jgi:peptidoglycan/xylan/chitin deacetylase (PgdA/CDA1 family)
MHEELAESRRRLEDVVQRPVVEAACPFGAYDRRVLGGLRQAGYTHVYTSDRGTAWSNGWLQPRNTVLHDDDDGILRDILALENSPGRALRRRARQAVKRWR